MKSFIAVLILIFAGLPLLAEVVVISGVYQGKDLYVKNPPSSSGVGFCIFEVLVNGQVSADEVNSPAFAVDLGAWGLKTGQPLEIVFRCKESCPVKIINPEVIYPNSTFEVSSITLSPEGLLTWTTKKESASIPYIIEQYKWNRWVKLGEAQGTGKPESHTYSFNANLHAGSNLFRVMQIDHKGAHFSPEVKADCKNQPVSIVSTKVSKTIDFSAPTDYEIYSEYGALIKSGRDKTVDVS
ncbi:MAG: hypothetical protein IT223_00960, partial [Crocinitomicaceae bacterium]|nr:hypothetical protein [Crocinitomicaceae bacterium]